MDTNGRLDLKFKTKFYPQTESFLSMKNPNVPLRNTDENYEEVMTYYVTTNHSGLTILANSLY